MTHGRKGSIYVYPLLLYAEQELTPAQALFAFGLCPQSAADGAVVRPAARGAPDGRPAGYTVCPLISGDNSRVMAEIDYRQRPNSSFLVESTKQRCA